jgi:hypothetical protein
LAAEPIKQAGALRVELNPNGAAMQFVTTDGVVRDSAVVACDAEDQAPDIEAPSAPVNLQAARNPDGSVILSWSPGLDETGIAEYDIYRNDALIGSAPPAASFVDHPPDGEADYWVVARDVAGNRSPASDTVTPEGAADGAVLFSDDFGGGSLSRWTEVSGLVVEPADDAASSWIARARGGIRPAYARVDLPATEPGEEIDLKVTVSFCQLDQGPNPAVLFRLRSSSGESLFGVSVTERNAIGLFNDLLGSGASSDRQITRGERHEVVAQLSGTGDAVTLTLYLDGEALPELTSTFSLGDVAIGGLQLGDSRSGRLFDLQFFGVTVASESLAPTELDQIAPSPIKVQPPESGWSAARPQVSRLSISALPPGPSMPLRSYPVIPRHRLRI